MRRLRVFAVVSCWFGGLVIGGSVALMVLAGAVWPYAVTLMVGVIALSNGINLLRLVSLTRKDDFSVSR